MAESYKFVTMISTDRKNSKIVTAILDSASGQKLYRKDALPPLWLEVLLPVSASIRTVGNTSLYIEAAIRLPINIGRRNTTTCFIVAPSLGPVMIFEMAFVE